MSEKLTKEKFVNLGLGDAILRLVEVQFQKHLGFGDTATQNIEESKLIVQALNQYELDLGFDCDGDGDADTEQEIADNIDIFNQSAKTSCCRIVPEKSSTANRGESRTRATSSRRKSSQKRGSRR